MANKQTSLIKKTSNFDFVKQGKWFMLGSFILILIGIIVMAVVGLKLGLDFTGGSIMELEIGAPLQTEKNFTDDFKPTVANVLSDHDVNMHTARIDRRTGTRGDFIVVRFQDVKGQDMEALRVTIRDDIITALEALPDYGLNIAALEPMTYDKGINDNLIKSIIIAVPIVIFLILCFIIFRFDFWSGISALIVLLHDAAIVLTFVAICGLAIEPAFVVVMLTVLVFSLNNIIVIFDKMRDTYKRNIKDNWKDNINYSIKTTLSRTIIMSVVILTAVVMLTILGVGPVKLFITPIIIGFIASIYSSVFVIPAVFGFITKRHKVEFKNRFGNRSKPQETVDITDVPTVRPTATPTPTDDNDE